MRRITLCLITLFSLLNIVDAQEDNQSFSYEVAQAIVAGAKQNYSTELFFNYLHLTELPPELWEMSEIKWLSLIGNDLTHLPPEIGQLKNLESLVLDYNYLTKLPSEIASLSNLEILSVNHNGIYELPSEIGGLHNLHSLWLQNNNLTELPSEIGQLSKLCLLSVSNNRLEYLPNELGHLRGLEQPNADCGTIYGLRLSNNSLSAFPEEIHRQGDTAILAYLRNQAAWHLRRTVSGFAAMVGGLAGVGLSVAALAITAQS